MRIVKRVKKLIAGFLLALFSFFPMNMAQEEEKEWFPFCMPWNYCKGSVVDVSYLLDAPAGKHGFLTVKNGHFYFQDGERARFWGLNIHSDRACFPDHSQAEDIAKRLAQLGCNIVRMHFLDNESPGGIIDSSHNDSQHFSDSQMEKLDYFIYQLKSNGIYISFDVLGLGARKFKAGDNVPEFDKIGPGAGRISFFNKRIIELSKKFAIDFLSHVNPYTGNSYINEPAIAMIEMTNENTLFEKRLYDQFQGYYKKEAENIYEKWVIDKGIKPRFIKTEWHKDRQFLFELQNMYQVEMREYLRSIGVKALIGASNLPYDNLALCADANMDFTDMHPYWDLCDRLDRIHNRPIVKQSHFNPQTIINMMAATKVNGKPFISTEWGSNWPNDWRAADVLTTASYAALNDWDALFLYSYMGGWSLSWDDLENKLYYGTVVFNDPAKMGLFPLGALIFLRGDVKPAFNTYKVSYPINRLFNMIDPYPDKLRLAGIAYVSKLEKSFYESDGKDSDSLEIKYPDIADLTKDKNKVISDTGEVVSDAENGVFMIKTPKTFSFSGFTGNVETQEFNGVKFSTKSNFATFTITSLDNKDIRDSRHLLLTVVGRARNKGQRLAPHLTKKPNDLTRDVYVLNRGAGPILVEPIEGNITIKGNHIGKGAKVFGLNEKGLRGSKISIDRGHDTLSFSVSAKYKTIYYEIIKE